MLNPKTQAWLYLVIGIVGIIAGSVYVLLDLSRSGSWVLFDIAIVGLGIFGVVQGVRSFARLKQMEQSRQEPGDENDAE